MKGILLIFAVFISSFAAVAHDYYFSFAEMEYNPITQKMEVTLTVTTHDFERALELQGKDIENIASLKDEEIDAISDYINQHFSLASGNDASHFNFVGHEVLLNGTTNFYLESDAIALHEEVSVSFNLLMKTFEEQQNKLTFYYEDRTFTAAFTKIDPSQTIHLENNEQ